MKGIKQMEAKKIPGPAMALLIPMVICVVVCIVNGVYPFGENCLLHVDMYHQYCPFFTELMRKLKEGTSLMYSWHIGLGSDFWSVYVYYLSSPLNWLLILCPKNHVIEFMSLFMIGKICLSGLFFYLFLDGHFGISASRKNGYQWVAVLFSTAYAFSGFVSAYSWNIMWMDSVALTPLILLGLERLVKEKKVALYYVTLALSIWSNYYISIMICLFLVMYFGYLLLTEKEQGEDIKALPACLRFGWYSLLAGGTSAILIIPEIKILGYSGSSGISFPQQMKWYFNIIGEIGRGFVTVSNYIGAEHWPNLYAGVFCFLLFFLYLMNDRISWKKKLLAAGGVVFFLLSFGNNYLDFIWHGLHFPDSLPGRQSFLYILVLLLLGYGQLWNWMGTKYRSIVLSLVLSLALCGGAMFFSKEEVTDGMSGIITCLFLVGYALLALLIKMVSGENRRFLKQVTFLLAFAEIVVHTLVTGFYTTSREAYMSKYDSYDKILEMVSEDADKEWYRLEDTERLTKNDGALYGYPSVSQFSSLMNINVSHFYQGLCMEGGKNFYCYNGATPVSSAMLGVKYFVSEEMLTASPLRTLLGRVDDLFVYRNNYCLSLGYVVEEGVDEALELSTSARRSGIDRLGYALRAEREMLASANCDVVVDTGETRILVKENGYYYAEKLNGSVDTLKVCDSYGRETEYSKTTHRYLFDLGYYKSGETVIIKNRGNEQIDFSVYALNMNSVDQAFHTLQQRQLTQLEVEDTRIKGHLEEGNAGVLVCSIPKEEGWKVYVDGKEQEAASFEETWLSVKVDEKEHEIELIYETPGLKMGGMLSGGFVLLFGLSIFVRRCLWKDRS